MAKLKSYTVLKINQFYDALQRHSKILVIALVVIFFLVYSYLSFSLLELSTI